MTKKQKVQLFRTSISKLEKAYPNSEIFQESDNLEQLLILILQFDSSPQKAAKALNLLLEEFVDWNEVRVSSVSEIAEVLDRVGIDADRARQIKTVLGELFVKKNQLSLDFLRRYQEKPANDFLKRFYLLPPSIIDEVMLLCLGFPRFPINKKNQRICERLGFIQDGMEEEESREVMISIIPKTKMSKAYALFSTHADEVCKTRKPNCAACVIRTHCDYYVKVGKPAASTKRSKSSKSSSRASTSKTSTTKKTATKKETASKKQNKSSVKKKVSTKKKTSKKKS